MERKRILSIDGGGIRGIIPLCALVKLEQQLQQPIHEHFSFVAGTSTGAIIAGALATGMTAERCLQLYRELGKEVFVLNPLDFVLTLGSFKYRCRPLHQFLSQFLGNPTLNALPANIEIMLTAMRVRDGRPYYFVRDNAFTRALPNHINTGELSLIDCIVASAAAPTFFEPWDVPGIGPCVDGGVGIAGNPAYQAAVEAFYYTPQGRWQPSTTSIVSLGTGVYHADAKPQNLIAWLRWTIGELLDEPIEQQTQLVQRHFVPVGTHLVRQNILLPREIEMDDFGAIEELVEIGMKAAESLDWNQMLTAPDGTRDIEPLPVLPRNKAD